MTIIDLEKKFKYPNGTLKNKFNITDHEKLNEIEKIFVDSNINRALKNYKRIPVTTINDLQKLHRSLFDEIYPWAGQIRNYELAKNNHDFFPQSLISNGINWINNELKQINDKPKPTGEEYANLLYDINELHPFREGNGRSTKTFLQIFAKKHNQHLEYQRHQDKLIEALNTGDIKKITELVKITDTKQNNNEKTKNFQNNDHELEL